jgi:hypothetical protein
MISPTCCAVKKHQFVKRRGREGVVEKEENGRGNDEWRGRRALFFFSTAHHQNK